MSSCDFCVYRKTCTYKTKLYDYLLELSNLIVTHPDFTTISEYPVVKCKYYKYERLFYFDKE